MAGFVGSLLVILDSLFGANAGFPIREPSVDYNCAQMDPNDLESMDNRMKRGDIDFDFLLKSFEMMKKLGSIKRIIRMISGLAAQLPEGALDNIDERKIWRTKAIIVSMTPMERRLPEILDVSRRQRIAIGSGTHLNEVSALIAQLFEMRRNAATDMGEGSSSTPLHHLRLPNLLIFFFI